MTIDFLTLGSCFMIFIHTKLILIHLKWHRLWVLHDTHLSCHAVEWRMHALNAHVVGSLVHWRERWKSSHWWLALIRSSMILLKSSLTLPNLSNQVVEFTIIGNESILLIGSRRGKFLRVTQRVLRPHHSLIVRLLLL